MNSVPVIAFTVILLRTVTASVLTYPFVQTTSGAVRGNKVKILEKEVHSYLGIPYATPPIGELRFRKPEPIKPWEGIYEASKKQSSCYQYRVAPLPWTVPNEDVSEDCLFLNIWAPKYKKQSGANLKPVLVWIHGGGFYSGSSSIDIYDGGVLAAYGDVVVASMNYRCGVFGFFSGKIEDAPGNVGLLDQVLALQWIKENVEAFGGNPSRITLFGESAGSVSVGLHLLSPMSNDLFSRAIMESGSPYHSLLGKSSDFVESLKADLFVKEVGCATDEMSLASHPQQVVACLRNKDPLVLAQTEISSLASKYFYGFVPRIGDNFLPSSPMDLLKSEKANAKDLLIGINSNEGSIFAYLVLLQMIEMKDAPKWSVEEGKAFIRAFFKDSINPPADAVVERYTKDIKEGNFKEVRQAVFNSFGDYLTACSTELFAENYANNATYFYYFDHYTKMSPWKEWLAMAHFDDVQFVFGIPLKNSKYSEDDVALSRYIMDRWISFAKTGVPLDPETGTWPKYNLEKKAYLQLKPNNYIIGNRPRQNMCDFWKEFFV